MGVVKGDVRRLERRRHHAHAGLVEDTPELLDETSCRDRGSARGVRKCGRTSFARIGRSEVAPGRIGHARLR